MSNHSYWTDIDFVQEEYDHHCSVNRSERVNTVLSLKNEELPIMNSLLLVNRGCCEIGHHSLCQSKHSEISERWSWGQCVNRYFFSSAVMDTLWLIRGYWQLFVSEHLGFRVLSMVAFFCALLELQKVCLGRCVVLLHLKMSIFAKQSHVRTLSGNLVYLIMEGNQEARKLLEALVPKVLKARPPSFLCINPLCTTTIVL